MLRLDLFGAAALLRRVASTAVLGWFAKRTLLVCADCNAAIGQNAGRQGVESPHWLQRARLPTNSEGTPSAQTSQWKTLWGHGRVVDCPRQRKGLRSTGCVAACCKRETADASQVVRPGAQGG
jgi:hypothetical protein